MIVAAEAGAEHTAAKARCLANDGANSDISSEVSTACSSAATGHNFTGSQKVMGNASPQHRRTNSAPPSLADGNAAGSAGAGHDVGTLLLQAFQLRDDYMVLQEAAHAKICELQAQLQAAHAEVHICRSQCQAAHRQLSLQNGMRCAKLLRGFFSAWSRQCLKNQVERAADKNLEVLHRQEKVSFSIWLHRHHLILDCWRAWAGTSASTTERAEFGVDGHIGHLVEHSNRSDPRQPSRAESSIRQAKTATPPTPPSAVVLTADGTATDPRLLPWDRRSVRAAGTSRTPPALTRATRAEVEADGVRAAGPSRTPPALTRATRAEVLTPPPQLRTSSLVPVLPIVRQPLCKVA
mmetsp:Transcript_110021/g.206231  ORF Transcript_110021/g.206231 Transcript_110021/m.206231 type:complete len:351 (+) Transcript_110021:46-1098(+)